MRDHQIKDSSHDFGKDVLPLLVQDQKVCAYKFGGEQGRVTPDRYWRDHVHADKDAPANGKKILGGLVPDCNKTDLAIAVILGIYPTGLKLCCFRTLRTDAF
jgi:glucose-1-phosphate adenylyltransferase